MSDNTSTRTETPHEFVAKFGSFDRYSDKVEGVVDFETTDLWSDDYVVFDRRAWEAMGRPQSVVVTITPVDR